MARDIRPPDDTPEARRLYRIGAGSVVLFTMTGIAVPMILLNSIAYDTELPGAALLDGIAGHWRWWSIGAIS